MDKNEIEKAIPYQLADTVEYVNGSVIIKSILSKKTGMVTISSFDTGESMLSKSSPFDSLIHIIDGEAEITINQKMNILQTGQAIIVPAHAQNRIRANIRFKMLSTVIKSGYDDINL